jgi:hypothetical protein
MLAARRPVCAPSHRDPRSDADLKAVRDAGYTDAKVVQIVAAGGHVLPDEVFDNVLDPEKDFPVVTRAGGCHVRA